MRVINYYKLFMQLWEIDSKGFTSRVIQRFEKDNSTQEVGSRMVRAMILMTFSSNLRFEFS